jgi:hypothetical protein
MRKPTDDKLSPWVDPDELLDTLALLSHDDRAQYQCSVEALLEHSDPDVRQEAIRILFMLWKARELHEFALAAFLHDAEPEVRASASYAVTASSSSATHQRDVNAFLSVLLDERQPTFVRGTAYDALLILHKRPHFPSMLREFEPSTDVDWVWISTLGDQEPEA